VNEKDRLERRLLRAMADAIRDFDLVGDGDRILVAVSGGKDSYGLLHLLLALRARAPVAFDLVAVNLDQGHPGFPADVLRRHFEGLGVPHRMLKQDTYAIVKRLVPEGKTYCPVCSRLRRGILYNAAVELGCNKIALGHHRDDLIETLLMSAFYTGALKTMPPKLFSDDGRNVVIRPLCYAAEEDLARFAELERFPIIPCDLCGSQENLKRKQVKRLIAELAASNRAIKGNLLNATRNVVATHLLDRDLLGKLRSTGKDPWIDEDELGCGTTEGAGEVISLGPPPEPKEAAEDGNALAGRGLARPDAGR
jgi:tRNA 2-thiocytidine biosynthesis protein TtcA